MPRLDYPPLKFFLLLVTSALLAAPPVLSQGVEDDPVYTLNTGDHVQVAVFEEPDLSIEAVLDDTGAISFPLLGELVVRGLTPRDLESRIT